MSDSAAAPAGPPPAATTCHLPWASLRTTASVRLLEPAGRCRPCRGSSPAGRSRRPARSSSTAPGCSPGAGPGRSFLPIWVRSGTDFLPSLPTRWQLRHWTRALEEHLPAGVRVARQGQDRLRLDDVAQPLDALLLGQETLEQVAHLPGRHGRRASAGRPPRGRCRDAAGIESPQQVQGAAGGGQQPVDGASVAAVGSSTRLSSAALLLVGDRERAVGFCPVSPGACGSSRGSGRGRARRRRSSRRTACGRGPSFAMR